MNNQQHKKKLNNIWILLNTSKEEIKNKTKYEYERQMLFRNAQFIQKLALMF